MNSSFEIIRNSPNIFSLKLPNNFSKSNSLINFLNKELINTNFNIKNVSFTFQSTNAYIMNCKHRINYSDALLMMHSLSKQILYLKHLGFGLLGFNIKNILCIQDKGIYVYLYDDSEIINLDTDGNIHLLSYKDLSNYIYSPEHEYLSSSTNYNFIYNSLGYITLLFLNGEKREKNTDIMLAPIKYTKLYWYILRAMSPKRIILFV